MSKPPCLSDLLPNLSKSSRASGAHESHKKSDKRLETLQLKMLRIQQGIWHQKRRAVIAFEGFDAAGKGGAIRRLVEPLDPRGCQVFGIGPPEADEQARHYLYRFWTKIPLPGTIAVFDRTWYGRVLVERVEKLTPKNRWKQAYREINEFESMLMDDGIDLIKIFLAIDQKEQLKRFEERLHDPYKQWKLTDADVEARSKWDYYVEAADEMFAKTHSKKAPWHLVAANDKHYARDAVLSIVTQGLAHHGRWMEDKAQSQNAESLESALDHLGLAMKDIKR